MYINTELSQPIIGLKKYKDFAILVKFLALMWIFHTGEDPVGKRLEKKLRPGKSLFFKRRLIWLGMVIILKIETITFNFQG